MAHSMRWTLVTSYAAASIRYVVSKQSKGRRSKRQLCTLVESLSLAAALQAKRTCVVLVLVKLPAQRPHLPQLCCRCIWCIY